VVQSQLLSGWWREPVVALLIAVAVRVVLADGVLVGLQGVL
jgi:hypothetical protein